MEAIQIFLTTETTNPDKRNPIETRDHHWKLMKGFDLYEYIDKLLYTNHWKEKLNLRTSEMFQKVFF